MIKSETMRKNKTNNKGFTLTEAMVAAAIAVIVMLGISIALYDSQRGWNATYNRVYSEVVTGTHVAQRAFDAVVRKSSNQWFLLDEDGQWVEVYYYADPNSLLIDRYARFFESQGDLCVEYGNRKPREPISVETICDNVTFCAFQQTGRSMQMILTLDNGREKLDTTTSAVLHN
jgi:prepilin-type N-terminal cleavage/methylation domain-containing protein